jgi:HD-GYP domain-containing protein (c-di-GMP phosphodiesterase class II)
MPLTTTLRVCLAAMRIADILDDDSIDRFALYHYSLVRLLGCTAGTSQFSAAFGDEIAIGKVMAPVDRGSPREMVPLVLRHVGVGSSPLRRVQMIVSLASSMKPLLAGHCEVSRMLTRHLDLGPEVTRALDFTYERWDGKGAPAGARGEAIPLVARVMQGAFLTVMQEALGGVDAVRTAARKRSGGELDPRIGEVVGAHAQNILESTQVPSPWAAVLASEPGPSRPLTTEQVHATAEAVAAFADLKADHLAGHSAGVAATARAAGVARGLADSDLEQLHRAALIHDLGRVGVTTSIWDRAGPLGDDDWEEVRLHAYHTERVAGRVPWLADAARIAALHHERMDSSGYHRSAPASELSTSARLLAAADCYHALTEERPHRPAFPMDTAARMLREEATSGRLDSASVRDVLESAGHRVPRARHDLPAGLTEREVDILRLVAAGNTIKQAAHLLSVAPKTVDAHLQHIYGKVGCTTRAGATVFAMQHGLLEPSASPASAR